LRSRRTLDPPRAQGTLNLAVRIRYPLFLPKKSAVEVRESARVRPGGAAFVTDRSLIKSVDFARGVDREGGAELVGPHSAL
jgi:hypothetical protein